MKQKHGNNFMARPRSYIGWLLVSLVLWAAAWAYYVRFNAAPSPVSMLQQVERDLQNKLRQLLRFQDNTLLLDRIWRGQLSGEDLAYMTAQPFVVFAYEKDKLVFWNTNKIVTARRELPVKPRAIIDHQSCFIGQRIYNKGDSSRYLQVLIPVYRSYDIENEYLHSAFVAAENIPPGSEISETPGAGLMPVRSVDGSPLFYLEIAKERILPQEPDNIVVLIVCFALAALLISMHLIAISLSRRYAVGWGIMFLVAFVVILRGLNYKFGMPFHLELRMIFSPQVFASSALLPSFGDLLLNLLALFWIFIFITSQSRKHIAPGMRAGNKLVLGLFFCLIQLALFSFGLMLMYLIKVLVLDSDISFDTSTFDATNKYTLLVLVAIAIIARVGIYATEAANIYADKLIGYKWYKYLATIVMAGLVAFVLRPHLMTDQRWPASPIEDVFYMLVFLLMVLYIYLKDRIHFLQNKFRLSLFSLLFWSVYASLLCTIMFSYYVYQQERYITRIAFAEKLSRQQDADLELMFGEIVSQVNADSVVLNWLTSADSIDNKRIYRHFGIQYISPYLSRYRTNIFLYKADGRPLSHERGVPIDTLEKSIEKAIPTLNEALYFSSNNAGDERYYIARIPVTDPVSSVLLGYVCMEIDIRKDIPESLYPELLDVHKKASGRKTPEYSYAIYKNGQLTYQSGTYVFGTRLDNIPASPQRWYVDGRGYSECYYKAGRGVVYVVAHREDLLRDTLSIFSFLFGIYFFFCLAESLVKRILVYFLFGGRSRLLPDLSLSFKVKYFVIVFSFLSFLVIGFSTIISLTNKYRKDNREEGRQIMDNVSEVLGQYFVLHNSKVSAENFRRVLADPEFVYFLSNIALQQKLDVNIYDAEGKLVTTTQEHMYNKHLQARLIAPEAFFGMGHRRPGVFMQEEHIGDLAFISLYAPIRNHSGHTIGYLNIPSFYSGLSLQSQIASLLTTLVNIYTVLLLLSGVVTYLFIRNLTNSLRLVANKLEKVNLQKNELIDWPYQDEIGMLVGEYNKMVLAVEKHAAALAQDERQSAWREMAKQVAHEIKNPLTPMKLNIQYLQQAINNNHPDIIQLVKKVSASIIEQIDNLNYIASEFSNFAKLPEKNTEPIDMVALLGRIVSLYSNEDRLTMHYAHPDAAPDVYADKSQMLRIFTNIIKNAVDAIPEERQGTIDVRLTLEEEAVLIAVADNGSGFTQEIRERIFEPYFTTKSSGTGLGLAMTKKIIELWEGTIWFESESGVGTTCFVRLPFGKPTH